MYHMFSIPRNMSNINMSPKAVEDDRSKLLAQPNKVHNFRKMLPITMLEVTIRSEKKLLIYV